MYTRPILFLAQAELSQALGKIAGVINGISMLLFFVALILAGIMVTIGRTEFVKHALVGSAIGGCSWLIVSAMFEAAGTAPTDIDISL
ncbi:MAG: hypothetical protein KDN22_10100 [Verrucomicrobiae bacterium]|nr:hypothetical protein [Verrucomicrobiae bacterium]